MIRNDKNGIFFESHLILRPISLPLFNDLSPIFCFVVVRLIAVPWSTSMLRALLEEKLLLPSISLDIDSTSLNALALRPLIELDISEELQQSVSSSFLNFV